MARTRIRYRCAKGYMILNRPLHTKMASLVCGLQAAPRPHWYGHRQACPGVTQAVSYDPRDLHPTRRWSRLSGSIRALALPFSTQIPDCAVPHTFVQPIDCLMPNPRPGDANRVSGTSVWREGVTAPTLSHLAPVPGCLLGREPATCPCSAGRPKIYPGLHL